MSMRRRGGGWQAERLAQALTTKPQPVVPIIPERVPEVVHRQTPAAVPAVRERPELRLGEARVMPKPAVQPKPMSEARPLPDDLTGWVKRPADVARRDAVKGAMQHAWSSYEKFAWGSDELCPKTQRGKNLFGPYPSLTPPLARVPSGLVAGERCLVARWAQACAVVVVGRACMSVHAAVRSVRGPAGALSARHCIRGRL